MVTTVGATVVTHNLAIGGGAGVTAAMILFARRVAHLVDVAGSLSADATTRTYVVTGELFFASDRGLVGSFDYLGDPERVVIDLSRAHIWDASAVAALDAVETRYAARGVAVDIVGLNHRSGALHGRLSGPRRPLTEVARHGRATLPQRKAPATGGSGIRRSPVSRKREPPSQPTPGHAAHR